MTLPLHDEIARLRELKGYDLSRVRLKKHLHAALNALEELEGENGLVYLEKHIKQAGGADWHQGYIHQMRLSAAAKLAGGGE